MHAPECRAEERRQGSGARTRGNATLTTESGKQMTQEKIEQNSRARMQDDIGQVEPECVRAPEKIIKNE